MPCAHSFDCCRFVRASVYGFAVFHWFRVCEHWMFHQFLIRVATKKPFYFCIRLSCTRKYGEIWWYTRQTTLCYAIAMRWKITENEAGPILKRNLPLLNDSYWKIVLQMTLKFQSTFYLGQFWLHFFSRYFSYVRSCFECKNEQVWIHCELSLSMIFIFIFDANAIQIRGIVIWIHIEMLTHKTHSRCTHPYFHLMRPLIFIKTACCWTFIEMKWVLLFPCEYISFITLLIN